MLPRPAAAPSPISARTRLDELRPGLWRWTAAHPDWEADPDPRDEFAARYGASTSRAKKNLPEDVEPIPTRGAREALARELA